MKTANKLAILMGSLTAMSMTNGFIQGRPVYETKEERERQSTRRRKAKGILTDSDHEALRKAQERRERKALKQGYC